MASTTADLLPLRTTSAAKAWFLAPVDKTPQTGHVCVQLTFVPVPPHSCNLATEPS